MEAIGIGRLRFDRGDTVMNKNEMGFLRMISGGVGQKLLDNCII
jgi:small subunit ribosomal protein S29